jgi:hypothetical protein
MMRLMPGTPRQARSTFIVPSSEISMVITGFLRTVSTPAIDAMWTT